MIGWLHIHMIYIGPSLIYVRTQNTPIHIMIAISFVCVLFKILGISVYIMKFVMLEKIVFNFKD